MAENPRNIIRSWGLQSNWANGPVATNKLVPPVYGRIRHNFVQTWREESLSSGLDFGSQNFSVLLPQSLQVVSSIFLKIVLPDLAGPATYKAYQGLYIIKTFRMLTSGTEVYSCDYAAFLNDYCQSLSEEELRHFADAYLGGQSATGGGQTLLLPMLLPNSAYLNRNGHDTRGHGVFPCFTGQVQIELQLTMNPATFCASDPTAVAASLGSTAFMYHQIEMPSATLRQYSDNRGSYSIVTRRFTELTSGWQEAQAGVIQRLPYSQPQGVVTEIDFVAVPYDADDHRHSASNRIQPTSIKVIADSVVQRELDAPYKIKAELWANGFKPPHDFPSPGRICFAAHCAGTNTHMYTGGYNMQLASNVTIEVVFPQHVSYKIIAVQLQRVRMDNLGNLNAYLE